MHIDLSKDKAKLDEIAKNLIGHKITLAWILKACMEEFKGFDVVDIANNWIVGEVKAGQDMLEEDARVIEANTENKQHNEGLINHDILFEARVLGTDKLIGLMINVENPGDMDLGYPDCHAYNHYRLSLGKRARGNRVFQLGLWRDLGSLQHFMMCLL